MTIHRKKCTVMMFNRHWAYGGMPKVTLSGMEEGYIEVVEKLELLGVKSEVA